MPNAYIFLSFAFRHLHLCQCCWILFLVFLSFSQCCHYDSFNSWSSTLNCCIQIRVQIKTSQTVHSLVVCLPFDEYNVNSRKIVESKKDSERVRKVMRSQLVNSCAFTVQLITLHWLWTKSEQSKREEVERQKSRMAANFIRASKSSISHEIASRDILTESYYYCCSSATLFPYIFFYLFTFLPVLFCSLSLSLFFYQLTFRCIHNNQHNYILLLRSEALPCDKNIAFRWTKFWRILGFGSPATMVQSISIRVFVYVTRAHFRSIFS